MVNRTAAGGTAAILTVLGLLAGGCSSMTETDLIYQSREKIATLEEERQLSAACHRRSMQRIKEFRACLRLPFRSVEQQACYEALQDTSAYTKQLDCREYHEKTAHFRSQYKKAAEICLAIYPSSDLSDMEEFSACMNERIGWTEDVSTR